MGHVDASGVIQLKGRTACEINTANELVATELTFGGIFAEFSVEQTVALLSCFTFDEKGRGDETNPGSGLRPGKYRAGGLYFCVRRFKVKTNKQMMIITFLRTPSETSSMRTTMLFLP